MRKAKERAEAAKEQTELKANDQAELRRVIREAGREVASAVHSKVVADWIIGGFLGVCIIIAGCCAGC